jgi:hypothetical protein
MFSLAYGSAAPSSVITSPSASRPRAKIAAARIALSQTDSAEELSGNTVRSTMPLWDNSQ